MKRYICLAAFATTLFTTTLLIAPPAFADICQVGEAGCEEAPPPKEKDSENQTAGKESPGSSGGETQPAPTGGDNKTSNE